MNECFSRRLLVKEEKNFYAYSKNNLKKIIEENIESELLDLNMQNTLNSPPTSFNLRALCFHRGLINNLDTRTRPRKSEYYERLLRFRTTINRKGRSLILLEARGKGFLNYDIDNSNDSFNFLKKQKYPDTVEELLLMNETIDENGENLIEKYNRGINSSYEWLESNILNMERYPLGHKKFSKLLLYKILQIHFPYVLEETDIISSSDPRKLLNIITILGV